MADEDKAAEIKDLQKQIRILQKKLERSETDRARLEVTNRNKESLLKGVICELEASQAVLEKKNLDVERAFNDLTLMQDKLVEAEKMAALGGLVAGVAHEINTPVGTCITVASTLMIETESLLAAVAANRLKRSLLDGYLEVAKESTDLLLRNLERAGELIQSFKQVAVDQSSLEKRTFALKPYLEELVVSLSPQLKKGSHQVTIAGDETIEMHSYPGAIAQVVTNLITNSLLHAYKNGEKGHLELRATKRDDRILLIYRDDGGGIERDNLKRVFDPFFTTARDRGGTGLGLHITYNLVTQKLQGKISLTSEVGKGTEFTIELPDRINS
ncbi:MAG: sensor histidine kinase [Cyanosarcina radialis HA8281-LM2]|jgi:signal transduction histidine kinase|nr:sensor histidine kinase [Cyanosarcina radialis HA8281-LM2]